MSRACNRPNRSNRVFRAGWMFYMRESRRNELIASIAILAIIALFVPRFSHVAYTIAQKVPWAKRVPIKKKTHSWYWLRRNSNLYANIFLDKTHCTVAANIDYSFSIGKMVLFPATSNRPNKFADSSSQKRCHFSKTIYQPILAVTIPP
jgi:hypothetical protein